MAVFKVLRLGDRGPQVQLLQLALTRAGYPTGTDGVFGPETQRNLISFQKSRNLTQDGIAGKNTWNGLMPYLLGYTTHTVKRGDTLYKIARQYGSTVELIETANPGINILSLQVGRMLNVPFDFSVTPTNIPFTSTVLELALTGLKVRYPFIRLSSAGKSVMGKDIYAAEIGTGSTQVFYNASHHANEWITTPLLVKFLEDYASAVSSGGKIGDYSSAELYQKATLYLTPMVNPDGVDLVTGELTQGPYFEGAVRISEAYPNIPFPGGWKANIRGVDPNLQYPAGWENAREIKFAQGYVSPAPRDFVGTSPLEAPESRAVYNYTLDHDFAITVSYHTQGEVIYWQYLDYEPENAYEIARRFSELSGYAVEDVPYASGFAGYKDWFIFRYNRPGYTIEAGKGTAPLPISDFDRIYRDNIGILTYGLAAVSNS